MKTGSVYFYCDPDSMRPVYVGSTHDGDTERRFRLMKFLFFMMRKIMSWIY